MKKVMLFQVILFVSLCFFLTAGINAQNVAVTDDESYTANPSAMLDVKATNKGMLVPRLTTFERLAITNPATGLLVFDSTLKAFFYYNGTKWLNLSSSSADTLWVAKPKAIYLKDTAMHFGVGTSQPSGKLEVKADPSAGLNDPIFAVVNTAGDTVFAVYPEGVRIYVKDTPGKASGSKGGFAVGGYSPSKGVTNEYLRITPDSIRIYVDTSASTKGSGSKGGFAVGGYSPSKGGIMQEYLRVSDDSVRIYVKDGTGKGSGSKGGFAVGGYTPSKGTGIQNYLNVTPDSTRIFMNDSTAGFGISSKQGSKSLMLVKLNRPNYFIGHQSGDSVVLGPTGAKHNCVFGYQSGMSLKNGESNCFMGYRTGFRTTSGSRNVYIGKESGMKSQLGCENVFIGYQCGYETTNGIKNIFLGYQTGYNNIGGNLVAEEGSFNTFIGNQAGYNNKDGGSNTYIGYQSGYENISGIHNTYIGRWSGQKNKGNYNVFIGTEAGRYVVNASYRLHIDARNSTSYAFPLIYGDFNSAGNRRQVIIDGDSTTLLNPNYTFFVNGPAGGNGNWNVPSDAQLKTNINTINNALEKVMQLHGVTFEWKDMERFSDGQQMGLIAQEAENIIPQVVNKSNGFYTMQYAPITALLIEAMKEQQMIIDQMKQENNNLKNEIEEIKSLIKK